MENSAQFHSAPALGFLPEYTEPQPRDAARIAELEREVASLRRRDRELTDFLENSAIGFHWVGADGTILWVNQAELDSLGYRKEEYVGRHIAGFHQDPHVIQDILQRLQGHETLRNYPARLRARDGSIRHVLINSNVLWEGERFVHTRCITRDITARVLAEEDLRIAHEEARKREELFRAALQGSSVVVFHQNADLRYTSVYNPFTEHTGISLVGKLDSDLFPPDQATQLSRLKLGVLASGKGIRQELALTTQGELRVMDVRIEPFHDSSGQPAGILGTAVDITERKRNEQRLTDSRERLRSLAAHLQFLREKERALTSHEVHDIGQTLTALDQQLFLLGRHMADRANPDLMAERLKAVSEILCSTIESSARISTDLRPSLLDTLGLAVALEWYAREFAARTGIRLATDAFENVPCDPATGISVFRILQHTLDNVERHSFASEVRISLRRVKGRLILRVCDDGTGIGSDKLVDPKSLGLLAMRELALQSGGTIDIFGTAKVGTTVSLEIPLP